jgi:cytochrome c6
MSIFTPFIHPLNTDHKFFMVKKFCQRCLFPSLLLFSYCQTDQKSQYQAGSEKSGSLTVPNGALIFNQNCKICHGADGRLGLNGAKDLTASVLQKNERIELITKGKNIMPPFNTLLTEKEIEAVATFSLSLNQSTSK